MPRSLWRIGNRPVVIESGIYGEKQLHNEADIFIGNIHYCHYSGYFLFR